VRDQRAFQRHHRPLGGQRLAQFGLDGQWQVHD
jgi:hypothetical protein